MSEQTANGTTLEQRLEAVEREVADLKRQLAETQASPPAPAAVSWIDKMTGIIDKDEEEAFLQMVEYGRQYNAAAWPIDEPEAAPEL